MQRMSYISGGSFLILFHFHIHYVVAILKMPNNLSLVFCGHICLYFVIMWGPTETTVGCVRIRRNIAIFFLFLLPCKTQYVEKH